MNKFIRDRVLDSDEIGSLKNIASEAKKLEAELLSQVQKVVKPKNKGYWSECTNCDYSFLWNGGSKTCHDSKPANFCSICGSRLDWSEVQ